MIPNTINNFLKLPGVIGLGIFLVHEQIQPYMYFKKQLLWEEKQSLTQSIIRIVSHPGKFPESLDLFEFPIRGYYVYTYKINPSITLLVLTIKDIPALNLVLAKHLQNALKKDINNTIKTFQALTNTLPQTTAIATKTVTIAKPVNKDIHPTLAEKFTIKDFLDLFNHISKFVTSYIGLEITRSCWQLYRPNCEWLENFALKGTAEIIFLGCDTKSHERVGLRPQASIQACSLPDRGEIGNYIVSQLKGKKKSLIRQATMRIEDSGKGRKG